MGWNRVPPSESLSSDMLLEGSISEASTLGAGGPEGCAPEAEVRLEKLAWEDAWEALDLPADGGRPA